MRIKASRDDVPIEGRIIFLHKNELRVEIVKPYSGITAGSHILFGESKKEFVAGQDDITDEGKRAAVKILIQLYLFCKFFEEHDEALKERFDKIRPRLDALYASVKELYDMSKGMDRREFFQKEQKIIEQISWINHEYYREMAAHYPICNRMNMDTLLQLSMKL
jgi:hypothetical protein